MKIVKALTLAAVAVLGSACGRYYVNPNKMVGEPVDMVIDRWGPPLRSTTLSNGDVSYAWHMATTSMDGTREFFCNVNATATNGTVYHVTWSGNWCKM